jgi:tight adherence protein B
MTGPALAALGGFGVYLIYSSLALGRTSMWSRRSTRAPWSTRARSWLDQAGLPDVSVGELASATVLIAVVAGGAATLAFGGALPGIALGAFAATVPIISYRHRRSQRRSLAEEAWPAMIEEIRVLCGSAGRSIPQALLDVGRRGPDQLRSAFAAAERTWALTTEFSTTVDVLKAHLASPTADATCETLLVAHELGGGDLDRRLGELAEDRREDALGRKDARAKQSGVRFARRFVVIVPLGMALAGMSLGDGRSAYASPIGQVLVSSAIGLIIVCWIWSGRVMRLPVEERVFE